MARAKKSGSTGKASKAKDATIEEGASGEEVKVTADDEAMETAVAEETSDDEADKEPVAADDSKEPEGENTPYGQPDEPEAELTTEPTDETREPVEVRPDNSGTYPTPVPVVAEPQRSTFWPLVFGGVLAAGLGFLAAQLDLFGEPNRLPDLSGLTSGLEEQGARITALEGASPDLGPLDEVRSQIQELGIQLSGMDAQIADLGARIVALEDRPITSSEDRGLDDAYARELAALQKSVEEQRTEIESLLQNALSVEEATAKAAQASAAQAALAQIVAAIDSGQPFAEAVSTLQANGADDIPSALADHAETGVATLAELQAEFPSVSRVTLAAARANDPQETEGGLGSFLKRQLGARSVSPRDGTDADAILSRAEAAVREGRIGDALAETDGLSDAARSAMEEWLSKATSRHAAHDAANELAQRLTAN